MEYLERIATSLDDIAKSLKRQTELKAVELKSKENAFVNDEVKRIMKGA